LQNRSAEAYAPAEDTFFLASFVEKERGESALEIGTGSGYLAQILQQNFGLVVATDIDFVALHEGKAQNKVCCDAADALAQKFDLIICNLPYLPSDQITDSAVDGGKQGLQVPFKIIESASSRVRNGGKMLFLTSSLADYEKLMDAMSSRGFSASVLAKKKLFFEELIIVEAKKLSS
jgi:release factor glutamine methyltransferase